MNVLGIETATVALSVALVDESGERAGVSVRGTRHHAELVPPAIEQVLAAGECRLEELGAVAVDIGPGRFTGLRVGVAAAKGLALALGVPLVGIESTAALKRATEWSERRVVPIVDLRRGEVAYDLGFGDGPAKATPGQLLALLEADPEQLPVVLVGDGALAHEDELDGALEGLVQVVRKDFTAPSAREIGTLALEVLAGGARPSPESVGIVYLREADVSVHWTTRDPVATPSTASGVEAVGR